MFSSLAKSGSRVVVFLQGSKGSGVSLWKAAAAVGVALGLSNAAGYQMGKKKKKKRWWE